MAAYMLRIDTNIGPSITTRIQIPDMRTMNR